RLPRRFSGLIINKISMNKLYTLHNGMNASPGLTRRSFHGKRGYLFILFLALLAGNFQRASAQATCGANVPSFYVDFTGVPDSVWTSPTLTRQGNCCGTASPDRCLRIEFTIDSN